MPRTLAFATADVRTEQAEWAVLDPGEEPSRGARLAVTSREAGVTFLLVELEPHGEIALHATPEASVCYFVEGSGTLFFDSGERFTIVQGDTIRLAPDLPHGWQGGREHTLVAVATYPASG